MSVTRGVAAALAAAFLDGAWTERAMIDRAEQALEPRPRWRRRLVRQVREQYPRPPVDRPRELAEVVHALLPRSAHIDPPRVVRHRAPEQRAERWRWPVARLDTPGDLAEALELDAGQLAWLADARGLERTVAAPRLRNYHYDLLPRTGCLPRVIERPKRRLAECQRWILRQVLDAVPPHEAAHGFVGGRSAVTNARAHVGAEVVLRFDVEDFFASVTAARVFGIFRTAGYPEGAAHALTGLTTNAIPAREWARVAAPARSELVHRHARMGRRLAAPHLPQGAPTSPALANLAAYRLDVRLTGLAAVFGATYTRYADDLTFSGGGALHAGAGTLRRAVAGVVRDEGLRLNERKSTLVTRAGRQRVCGIVVNDHPNLARREYDRLKAILHDAARNGPDAANRARHPEFRAHLEGRIAWVAQLNPARAAKLRARFDAVVW